MCCVVWYHLVPYHITCIGSYRIAAPGCCIVSCCGIPVCYKVVLYDIIAYYNRSYHNIPHLIVPFVIIICRVGSCHSICMFILSCLIENHIGCRRRILPSSINRLYVQPLALGLCISHIFSSSTNYIPIIDYRNILQIRTHSCARR